VDWPGIHTIMLTSVITSLPNLGASSQKGVLRVGGCLIGAALSLFAMVFVVPHLETIFGLLLMSLAVVALSAWVCAGSDKIAYAGTQIIFCFALALLEDFGPVYDLTIIRDRLIGIVLGVVITTAIQTFVWPEHEGALLIGKLAALLRGISSLLKPVSLPATPLMTLGGWNQVADCEALQVRVRFEPDRAREGARLSQGADVILASSRRLLLIVHDIHAARALMQGHPSPAVDALLDHASGCLLMYATQLDHAEQTPGNGSDVDRAFRVGLADLRLQLQALQDTVRSVHEMNILRGIEKIIVQLENLPDPF
jgi:multidrug resistance protein MdtO